MEGIQAAAILLWVTTLAFGGAVAVEGGAVDLGEDRDVSVDVETEVADVALENVSEDGEPTARVQAEGIDEGTERDAAAGLCVVGLDSEESPIGIATDSEDSTVELEADSEYDPDDSTHPHDGKTAQDIVDECATPPDE